MNNDLGDIRVSEDNSQLRRAFNTCIPQTQTHLNDGKILGRIL